MRSNVVYNDAIVLDIGIPPYILSAGSSLKPYMKPGVYAYRHRNSEDNVYNDNMEIKDGKVIVPYLVGNTAKLENGVMVNTNTLKVGDRIDLGYTILTIQPDMFFEYDWSVEELGVRFYNLALQYNYAFRTPYFDQAIYALNKEHLRYCRSLGDIAVHLINYDIRIEADENMLENEEYYVHDDIYLPKPVLSALPNVINITDMLYQIIKIGDHLLLAQLGTTHKLYNMRLKNVNFL